MGRFDMSDDTPEPILDAPRRPRPSMARDVVRAGSVPRWAGVRTTANVRAVAANAPRVTGSMPAAGPVPQGGPRERLLDLERQMGQAPPHELLGVAATAPAEEIERAHLALVKDIHPDRIAAQGMADLRETAERVMARVNQARDALLAMAKAGASGEFARIATDPGRRRADLCFKKGEVLFKKGDLVGAEIHFAQAVTASPPGDPVHQAYLAWTRFANPQGAGDPEARAVDAEAVLAALVESHPDVALAHHFFAEILRHNGQIARAQDAYRNALRADPSLVDAERQLRLLRMRARDSLSSIEVAGSGRREPAQGRRAVIGGLLVLLAAGAAVTIAYVGGGAPVTERLQFVGGAPAAPAAAVPVAPAAVAVPAAAETAGVPSSGGANAGPASAAPALPAAPTPGPRAGGASPGPIGGAASAAANNVPSPPASGGTGEVPGRLVISTVPPGADVWIDGRLRGASPLDADVGAGSHQVVLIAEGFRVAKHSVDATQGARVDETMVRVQRQGGGAAGVKVRCHGDGRFPVLVDGQETGALCPTERIAVEPGDHEIGLLDPRSGQARSQTRRINEGRSSTRIYFGE